MAKTTIQHQTIPNGPPPETSKLGSDSLVALVGVALILFLLRYVFKKGQKTGVEAAQEIYFKKIDELNDRISLRIESLARVQRELEKSFEKAHIVPDGHIQIPLNEGVSLHRLPTNYILRIERRLEHRHVAEKLLCRELEKNEIVHHIYGPATDNNSPENLCVIDTTRHQLFHTYLDWLKEKTSRYPTVQNQKIILKKEYGGILLEEAAASLKPTFPPAPLFLDLNALVPVEE